MHDEAKIGFHVPVAPEEREKKTYYAFKRKPWHKRALPSRKAGKKAQVGNQELCMR